MTLNDKEKLIKELATHMGVVDNFSTRYGPSRYDASTGTLYCEGVVVPHSSLVKIKDWYKHQMDVTRDIATRDKSQMETYMRYAVAYNAISLLKDNIEDAE